MKNLIKLFAIVIIGITITFISCNKDNNKSNPTPPSGVVGTTISGVVYSTNHMPLNNVEVTVGTYTKTTGQDGAFLFENMPVSNDRYKVEFVKDGYFETYRAGKANVNGVTKVEISMVSISTTEPTTYTMSFNPSTGGLLSAFGDTLLYFPPNLNYKKEDGTTYVGNIDVFVKYVDASLPEYSQIATGGDQFGRVGSSDYYLNSFSGVMVVLLDNNGEKLELASNNTDSAQVHIQIPNTMLADAPNTIDTWYNGSNNLAYAVNSGSGRKTGGKYTASVGHFSLWSMQTKTTDYGTITGRVTDCNNEPVNGVRVQVGQTYAVTNNDGIYSSVVATGIDNIVVQVLAEDYFGNASIPIVENALTNGETRANIDIQLACVGTITGQLVNCEGQPVPGQVVVSDGMINLAKTYTENGYFELKFDQNATSYTIYAKGYNYSTEVFVNGAPFPYNAGDIVLCPPVPPPPGSNKVTIDGTTYTDFNVTAEGGIYVPNISLYAQGSNDYFSLELENATGVGPWPIHNGNISIGGQYYEINSGTGIINAFDEVGGRIIGTFTGTGMQGEAISGSFNMKRNPDSGQ